MAQVGQPRTGRARYRGESVGKFPFCNMLAQDSTHPSRALVSPHVASGVAWLRAPKPPNGAELAATAVEQRLIEPSRVKVSVKGFAQITP